MCDGIKKGLPPIEQHPSQICQRPVQKAQSQKKHCHRRVAEHELNRASQQQQLRRMESRFSSHYRNFPQTHADVLKHLWLPIPHSPVDGGASQ